MKKKLLSLAVVQFAPVFGQKKENLARIEALLLKIEADIIVLPELCTTGYFFTSREEVADQAEPAHSGRTSDFFQKMARRLDAVIVAGFAERDGQKLYNACLIQLPDEPIAHIYRKTHLFYKERFCFDVGDTGFFVVEDTRRDVRIGPMICYDWRFPEASRILTIKGADLIVCPSNLVTDAWRQVMPARAIENKVYLAVANRCGIEDRLGEQLLFKGNSAIYGYNGGEMAKAGPDTEAVLTVEIDPAGTRDKSFNPFNDILSDRQPQLYGALTGVRNEFKGMRDELKEKG